MGVFKGWTLWQNVVYSVCLGTVAGCGEDGNERVISGFRRNVDDIWAFLGYYAGYNCDSATTFRDNLLVPSSTVNSWPLEDGTDRLSRNVGTELPIYAALISQISTDLTVMNLRVLLKPPHFLKTWAPIRRTRNFPLQKAATCYLWQHLISSINLNIYCYHCYYYCSTVGLYSLPD